MGVSGAGKSTLGAALAVRRGVPFQDADALHGDANLAKLRAGQPLSDGDRWPWLDRVGDWLVAHPSGVVACSALRRSYRDRLRTWCPGAVFVLPELPREELARRLVGRVGHVMPPTLLGSQLETLEPLGDDEVGLVVDGLLPVAELVEAVESYLARSSR
jgi:gluconokinase